MSNVYVQSLNAERTMYRFVELLPPETNKLSDKFGLGDIIVAPGEEILVDLAWKQACQEAEDA